MGDSPFAITVQAVGTLMVAALLWQLTRLIPGLFLRSWSLAWVCLTWSLFCLRMTNADHLADGLRPVGFSGYLVGEYLFGFFLWSGFRAYANLQPPNPFILILLVPLGVVLPWAVREESVLPIHSVIMAGFFGASFAASLQIRRSLERPSVGLNIVRVILLGLTVIFLLYGPLHVWSRFVESLEGQYFRLSLIYYALVELGLAFGLVVLASERAQETLETKNRELAETSRRDALTGLYNRRYFDEVLEEHRGQTSSGALAVIDVNDLKLLNDQHLHTAGDAALKLVARSLVSRFRVTDPIFRVGGDEFAVIMPGCSEADLAARMADIDDSLMNLRIPGITEPSDLKIAWGVAPFTDGNAMVAAYDAADKAMYACKLRRKAHS